MALIVRPVALNESPAIERAIGNVVFAAHRQVWPDSHHDEYLKLLLDTKRRAQEADVLAAVLDGVVVGTVTYCPLGSSWREIGRDNEGEFRTLAVEPGHQGKGIGRALVAECVQRSQASGHQGMVLSSALEQHRGHALYEYLGFVRAPHRDWSPVPGVHLIVFEKEYQ
jgi:GNAT superfamily N-acetyltransferase